MMPEKIQKTPDLTPHWLNRTRLVKYCVTIMLASLIYTLRCAWIDWTLYGHPNGLDFTTFWAASRLWLDGSPLKAYSYDALTHTAAQYISPKLPFLGPFFYPPTFLLLLRPLAWLPSPLAYPLFALTTAGVFVFLLRRTVSTPGALLPILAFPGIWLAMAQGQNSCITASLALGAFMLLNTQPILAGVCIGMLSIKPHLAVLFPLALACAGMWSAFIAAGVTVALMTGISVSVFGLAAIPAFLHSVNLANKLLAIDALPLSQTASLFATLRLAHVPLTPAYVAQACQALAATTVVIWVWRKSRDLAVRATALVAATFMISPYVFNYDTAWLGVPIALFTGKALRDGWLPWEREILCVAWLYPVLGDFCGISLHVGFGPLVFASLLVVAMRRTRQERNVVTTAPPAESVLKHARGGDMSRANAATST